MKIVFFNRFFFPDSSATSQILSDLAFDVAASGAEVHVVTSKVPGAESAEDVVRGVRIHRVAQAFTGAHGLAQRAYAYISYYRGARRAARRLLEHGDIAVLMTDPPMLSAVVGPVASRRGASIVAWMQDIFPEVAHEYGVPLMGWPLGSLLRILRNRSLATADQVIAIGERMADRLASVGVPRERLRVIHNWADGDAIVPLPHHGNGLREQWNLGNAFVAEYSGNLGRVHEFDTILSAAALLQSNPAIRFVIVGRGPRLAQVQARAQREGLDNVRFEPHQPRDRLAQTLAVADVHLCVLQPRFDSLVLPSKMYGIMAAGRPIVFIGDPRGECAGLIAQADCGVTVSSGDARGLADSLLRLRADRMERERLGHNGRSAFEARFAMEKSLAQWRRVIDDLSLAHPSSP